MAGALTRFGARGLLGGASDPRARPAQEDRDGIVTRDDYRTGEKVAGISSLFSCRIGRTPVWGGHGPPAWREASRTRARSLRSLYTQVWTNLFSPPSSLVQQAASGENFSRRVITASVLFFGSCTVAATWSTSSAFVIHPSPLGGSHTRC